MKKLLLIDLDDTICASEAAYRIAERACYHYFKKLKPGLSLKKFDQIYWRARAAVHQQLGPTASSHNRFLYFQKMFELLKIKISPKNLNHVTKLFWQTTYRHLRLFPTVRETLQKLHHSKIKVGVVSDLLAEIQITKMEYLNIAQYFDFVVTSEEAGHDKPYHEIFDLALEKGQAKPSETIMLGNNCQKDIIGAKKMGIQTIHFGPKPCRNADYSITIFRQLLNLLKINAKTGLADEGYIKFHYTWHNQQTIPVVKIALLNRYRQKLHNQKLIGVYLNGIGYGNLSQRQNQHDFIITGTETGKLKKLQAENYALVTNWNFVKNSLVCFGKAVASSESLSHAAIYDIDKTANAVVHIHSEKLWRQYKNKLPTTPASASYGTVELTRQIKKLFKTKELKEKKVIILGGHRPGLIIFGKNLAEAYKTIKNL